MLLGAVDDARMWPTPKRQGLCGGDGSRTMIERMTDLSSDERSSMISGNGGQLNPTWVEWLQGYPLEWTALEASATRSSPRSRNGSRTGSSTQKS